MTQEHSKYVRREIYVIIRNDFLCDEWIEFAKDLFFSPLEEQEVIFMDDSSMVELVMLFPIFKSKSDCRKAGWHKEIPNGYSEFYIGKVKHELTIFKPFEIWIPYE